MGLDTAAAAECPTAPERLTCPVGRGPDEGGQHLDRRVVMRVFLQTSIHGLPQPIGHLLQLIVGQTEGLQVVEQLNTHKKGRKNSLIKLLILFKNIDTKVPRFLRDRKVFFSPLDGDIYERERREVELLNL